jgi:hypothetical protein
MMKRDEYGIVAHFDFGGEAIILTDEADGPARTPARRASRSTRRSRLSPAAPTIRSWAP